VLYFDLQIIFVLILNLVTTFVSYPFLDGACSYSPLVPLEISLSYVFSIGVMSSR
jgi:hypothetical protein